MLGRQWCGNICLVLLLTSRWSQAAEPRANPGVEFFRQYCIECHGTEAQEGNITLHDLTGNLHVEGIRWWTAIEQVRTGKMPPADAKQPPSVAKEQLLNWLRLELAHRPQRKPNHGNLVPHDLLFGKSPATDQIAASAPVPRLWRINSRAYMQWADDVLSGSPKGIVAPFSASAERGIKDFAELANVDEPTTEILLRNAELMVADQTRHKLVDGKVEAANDTIREFMPLMKPDQAASEKELHTAITKQFQLALARSPSAADLEQLTSFYGKCAKNGEYPSAAKAMLTAVLLRTDVIFRSELGAADGMLTPREAAEAISLALCERRESGIITAANKGQLTTREELGEHVRRILNDDKIKKPRVLGFFQEYFEYPHAVDVFKDEPKELWHRPDQHVRDTERLLNHFLQADRDVWRNILTSPLAFANVKMQTNKQTRVEEIQRALVPNAHNQRGKMLPEELYGMKEWHAEQPFEMPADTRLGILMQPSWLMAWSENFHNDIVRRGRFIRERLLGGIVPDLPIGVAAMVPNDKTLTLRTRVSSVTRAAACWKCHQHMDDLGLAFENFDHYGRLQTTEKVFDPEATEKNRDKKGKPLGEVYRDAELVTTGAITGTGDPQLDGPVRDPRELVQRLANSDRVRQVWIRHVFRYYLGRNESLADAASLQAADAAYQKSGGSYRELLVSLLTSDSFLKRQAPASTSK